MANHEIPNRGVEGIGRTSDLTSLGDDRSQTLPEVSTTERISTLYYLNSRIAYNCLDDIERTQQEWSRNEVEGKGNEGSRARRIGMALAEAAIPTLAGVAVDTTLEAVGAAGGPLVSAAVGAASGATRAALEYRHIGEDGRHAAELWQRNVGDKDRRTREGNIFQRGWGHISRFLKGGSYLGLEHGFKVKKRDEEIKEFMNALDIRTDANQETLTEPATVFDKLEQSYLRNPREYEAFVKKLMTQSVLSNFAEQKTLIEQKQMSDLFCIANVVLYKNDHLRSNSYGYSSGYDTYGTYGRPVPYSTGTYGGYGTPGYPSYPEYPGYPGADNPANATINRLWSETISDVREIVKKTRTSFIAGAAAERAIKSVVGFYAIKWITNGLDKVKELRQTKLDNATAVENAQSIDKTLDSDISQVNGEIDSLKTQINDLDIPQGEQGVQAIDYEKILEPAARASGQEIENYLSISERASVIRDLPEVSQALQDSETMNAIMSLSKSLGKTPAEVLHGGMLRWVYDKNRYGDIGEFFKQAVNGDTPAIWSMNQALGASSGTHPAWRDLADAILNNTTTGGAGKLEALQNLQDQLLGKQDLLNDLLTKEAGIAENLKSLNLEGKNISNLITKSIWEAGKRGAIGAAGAIADVISGAQPTNFMYGKKDKPGGRSPEYSIHSSVADRAASGAEKINNSLISKLSMSRKTSSSFNRLPKTGYNREGWRDSDKIKNDASRTYLNNNNGHTTEIIKEYFNKQETIHPESYGDVIKATADNLGPIKDDCKVSIAIPALGEEASIKNTLEQFSKLKPEDRKLFEVCILDTHPIASTDRTEEIVRDFMTRNPDMNIVYIKRDVEINTNVGESRKFLNDVILERVQKMSDENKKENHIIVSQDADLETFESKDYISNIINKFERDPNLEVLTGRSNLSREALTQAPAVLAAWRTWRTFDTMVDKAHKTVEKTIGTNTAIKARTLAGIGGYNPYLLIAEDLDIGWKVKSLKGKEKVTYSPSFGLEGEARRAFVAHMNGVPIIHMYDSFDDNKGLRGKDWKDILRENPDAFEFTMEKYTKELQALYNYCIRSGLSTDIFDNTMKTLGVKYSIDDGNVVIDPSTTINIADVIDREKRALERRKRAMA